MRLNIKAKIRADAQKIRKASGTTNLEKTLKKAVETLAIGGIPSLVAGGYVVQEYGYPRMTTDIDLIVPSVKDAMEYLSIRGFERAYSSNRTVTDLESGVEVDLLPGNGSVGPRPLLLPLPKTVSETPVFLSLEQLIATKLSSYIGNPISRSKDFSDVIELVKARRLPRSLNLPQEVLPEYLKLWDALKLELNRH